MVGLAVAFKRQLEFIHHNRVGADRDVIVLCASWCYRALSVQGVVFNMELAMKLSPFIALNAWKEDANLTKPFLASKYSLASKESGRSFLAPKTDYTRRD